MYIVIQCKMFQVLLVLMLGCDFINSKDLGRLTSSSQLWWGIRTPLRPRLLNSSPQNVTVMVGGTALLPCSVEYLGDRSVTWMRKRDLHILTADIFTYSADNRFKILHSDNTDDWTLQILFVTLRDEGIYECQINSDPKISRQVYLKVSENSQLDDPGMFIEKTDTRFPDYNFGKSETEEKSKKDKNANKRGKKGRKGRRKEGTIIHGPQERHIQEGSSLSLTCVVHHPLSEAPRNLVWLKGTHIMDYDSPRGGVSVKTEKLERKTVSKLSVASVTFKDSGQYACSPSGLQPTTVTVHVQNGQHQAAVYQSQANSSSRIKMSKAVTPFFVFVLLLRYLGFTGG